MCGQTINRKTMKLLPSTKSFMNSKPSVVRNHFEKPCSSSESTKSGAIASDTTLTPVFAFFFFIILAGTKTIFSFLTDDNKFEQNSEIFSFVLTFSCL